MKRTRFTEEQILFALKQGDAGQPIADVCRQMGISEATYYVWKKRYANMGILEVRELRQLRDENARLKGVSVWVVEILILRMSQAGAAISLRVGDGDGRRCWHERRFRRQEACPGKLYPGGAPPCCNSSTMEMMPARTRPPTRRWQSLICWRSNNLAAVRPFTTISIFEPAGPLSAPISTIVTVP
jgi:putative transposase